MQSNLFADEFLDRSQALHSQYRDQLAAAAKQLPSKGDTDVAEAIARWLPATEENQSWLFDPADVLHGEGRLASKTQFCKLRHAHAVRLFSLAEDAAQAGRASIALTLAAKALREDPNHVDARRVLGYKLIDGQWLTDYQQRMQRLGFVEHPKYGWVRDRDISRHEAGFWPSGGRWVRVIDDASGTPIQNGYLIQSPHFQLTTNHYPAEAVALAMQLESLHTLWSHLFADFWITDEHLKQMFSLAHRPPRSFRRMQVWYFANRDGYNRHLIRQQPRIGMTLGIYFDDHRRAYFFAGKDQHPATITHEVVHQLFGEVRPSARNIGRVDNFWIIEGIATYFESLQRYDDTHKGRYYTVGGADAGRIPAARHCLLNDGYYVPLAELVQLGKNDLQKRSDLPLLYSQMAGLSYFFMHAEHGAMRPALVEYLQAVYTGRARAGTLSDLTDKSYDELDAAYRRFMSR